MTDWTSDDLAEEFEREFHDAWDRHRSTPAPFKPRQPFIERVNVVSVKGDTAIIERIGEDGELYEATVPRSALT